MSGSEEKTRKSALLLTEVDGTSIIIMWPGYGPHSNFLGVFA